MSYGVQSGAVAWAESIRENLVSEAMPPWYADPAGPAVRGGHVLSPRELDIVVTWATGGTPQGDQRKTPAPMKAHEDWSLGKPDLVLQPPQESTLGPGQMEKSMDFAIPTALGAARWVKAIDLCPVRRLWYRAQPSPLNMARSSPRGSLEATRSWPPPVPHLNWTRERRSWHTFDTRSPIWRNRRRRPTAARSVCISRTRRHPRETFNRSP